MPRPPRSLILLPLLAALWALPAFGQGPSEAPAGYPAITKPSKDLTISFVRPARVEEVLVAKGDWVKAGQLIARQNDLEEQASLSIDKKKAEDTTSIDAETAVREQKAKDAERMEKSGGVGILELQNAQLEVKVADARILMAKSQHEQDQLKLQATTLAVEKLKVYAPIDGVIAEEFLKAGESADGGNMKLVRIVQLDPLWIEVPVPVLQARKIHKDDAATVTGADGKDHTGKVVVVSPVADSASDTILVRVEMPNPQKISSGETVYVNFGPAPVQVGAAAKPETH